MSHSRYTRIPITEMIFALPVDQWQLRLVPDDDHNNLSVLSPVYTKAQLLRSVSFLRGENKNGYHIYGRPICYRHILVDDLDQDALDQLVEDGLRPNVVVRTSPNNYQVWITISVEEITSEIAAATSKILAKRYGGDPGSTDALHPGRFPGFTNRKFIYWTENGYPFTGLHGKVSRGVPPAATQLIIEAEKLSASSPPYTTSRGACVPTNSNLDIDPSRSSMTESEAVEIYRAEVDRLAKSFNWQMPIEVGYRSEVDHSVANSLWKYYGYTQDDVAAVLVHGSEKAIEKGKHATKYVEAIVGRAML
jgi:hypothetical protein